MNYKIGDRIKCISSYDGNDNILDELGTIIADKSDMGNYGIKFDKDVDGHTCSGRCKDFYGWWLPPSCFVKENINKRIG